MRVVTKGAERARASRARRLAADPEGFREAERVRAREYHERTFVPKTAGRECRNCGTPVHREGFCGARECELARNRERMRRYAHERRARLRGNEWEQFEPSEVYDRDGWLCGICTLPVDPALTWPDPGSVSLDHITPVSLGGSHTRDNTRCSHLGCNSKRGNRVV